MMTKVYPQVVLVGCAYLQQEQPGGTMLESNGKKRNKTKLHNQLFYDII
jgi:hypothetical protein